MFLVILSKIILRIASLWIMALLGFSQTSFAADSYPKQIKEENRIAKIMGNLEKYDDDKNEKISILLTAIGQYIAKDNMAGLENLFVELEGKIDIKEVINRHGKRSIPLIHKVMLNRASSKLVRFLLLYGANPEIRCRVRIKNVDRFYTAKQVAIACNQPEEILAILTEFETR